MNENKREKAIAEMAMVVRKNCDPSAHQCNLISCLKCELDMLYRAGYRKSDEVRKETINEFVETVKRCLPNEPYLHTWLGEIAFGKFGVEVEE